MFCSFVKVYCHGQFVGGGGGGGGGLFAICRGGGVIGILIGIFL